MPKTIKKLSKETEARLVSGLEKVSDLVNTGTHPTEAIYKIASELSLPAGQVKLMVHGFNNGRTLGQIRNGSSLNEKAADFDLADASEVLDRMFPGEIKTAGEQHNATSVADDYTLPPTYWMQRAQQAAKQAAAKQVVLPPMTDKKAEYPAYRDKDKQRLLADRQAHIKAAADAKLKKINAGYVAIGKLAELQQYFATPDCIPFPEVRDNAVLVKGAAAERLFKKLSTPRLEKQASHNAQPADWTSKPYSLVAECIKAAQEFSQAAARQRQAEKEATEKSAEALAPFCQPSGPRVITGSVWEDQSQTKEAGTMGGIAAGSIISQGARGLIDRLGGTPPEKLVEKQVQELSDPSHEAELQTIRTQAMLNDLMANDPVISGYDPEQVIDAFNQLSQMAPRVANQRMMAQALLRKYLEQANAMDMYDQTQVLGAERELSRMENVPGTFPTMTAMSPQQSPQQQQPQQKRLP